MADRQAFQQKMEAQLKEWSANIEVLQAKAEKASADAKIKHQQQIANLQERKEAAQKKLAELKSASDGAWENLKNGVEKAWAEFKNSVDDAVSQFK